LLAMTLPAELPADNELRDEYASAFLNCIYDCGRMGRLEHMDRLLSKSRTLTSQGEAGDLGRLYYLISVTNAAVFRAVAGESTDKGDLQNSGVELGVLAKRARTPEQCGLALSTGTEALLLAEAPDAARDLADELLSMPEVAPTDRLSAGFALVASGDPERGLTEFSAAVHDDDVDLSVVDWTQILAALIWPEVASAPGSFQSVLELLDDRRSELESIGS